MAEDSWEAERHGCNVDVVWCLRECNGFVVVVSLRVAIWETCLGVASWSTRAEADVSP